ncbi:MAG: B12-binding domain-containing radical SAM protein [Candidatus Omnitrophica bacterium]|nr:B12-binding domain-containing radical SAM protein [Candidatus Omnitrophota bacterium]
MKILVINVSVRPESKVIFIPLGLAYVASAIKRHGYKLEILDLDAERPSGEYIIQYLKNNKFDVVCMGCIVTGYKHIKQLARLIKQVNPDTKIIVGNSVASSIPEVLLTNTETDIAVLGEGDITITEVLDALRLSRNLKDIQGICYKEDGKIIKNLPRQPIGNIDTIPFPDWELFDMDKYIESCSKYVVRDPLPVPREEIKALAISTARGCTFRCTFCYQVFRDIKYRYISAPVLVQEMKRLKEKYQINYFMFNDDLTFASKSHVCEMAQCLLQEDLSIYWLATCRANLFKNESDVKLVKQLKAAGCIGLGYALESASPEILEMMNKKIDLKDFSKQSHILERSGLTSWTSIVFGYPIETKESIKKTIDCCIENDIYPSVGYLLPQPATPMYEYAVQHGFIKDEEEYLLSLGDRQDLRLNMTGMSNNEFQDAVHDAMQECNKRLKLNLQNNSLIKTGYYRSSKKILSEL